MPICTEDTSIPTTTHPKSEQLEVEEGRLSIGIGLSIIVILLRVELHGGGSGRCSMGRGREHDRFVQLQLQLRLKIVVPNDGLQLLVLTLFALFWRRKVLERRSAGSLHKISYSIKKID